ncbi:MAG: DNA repair exonuclease [Candidatus Micrarchaeota archaeon]
MAIRFAHIADVHLGAFRDATLREFNLEAFKRCLSECVAAKLDFVIIAGDLFHVALPDMRVVDEATKAMRACRDAGLRIYLVYGSHDYSPTATSVIDVLASAGVLCKIHSDDAAHPEIVIDAPTGARLAGACARSRGLENGFFEKAAWSEFEKTAGTKIFVFHSAIDEHKPEFLSRSEGIPLAQFPKGCAYYAGGHVHERAEIDEAQRGFGRIVFPGPLFSADYRDLEAASRHDWGYYVVEIDGARVKTEFKPIKLVGVISLEFNVAGKSASETSAALLEKASAAGVEVEGKIVLAKVFGELREGKPGEIDFAGVREAFAERGARVFYLNRGQLTAREATAQRVEGANKQEIEERAFAQASAAFETKNAFLRAEGARVAHELLRAFSKARDEEAKEKKGDYEVKMCREAAKILGID